MVTLSGVYCTLSRSQEFLSTMPKFQIALSTVKTLKRSKTIDLHVLTLVELYAHATNTRACDIFGHRFHFVAFSTVKTYTICMRFRFDSL